MDSSTPNHEPSADKPKKQSKDELIKLASNRLRATIAEELGNDEDHFAPDSLVSLKVHGIYQQDDRDERAARRAAQLPKRHSFMIRVRMPGGVVTPTQYSVIDDLATRFGSDSIRITSRQAFQLHGVIREHLPPTLRSIDRVLLTTFAACGDVGRNVMAPPVPFASVPYQYVRALAERVSGELLPSTNAYHEIWIDGERTEDQPVEIEPLYGDTYLPRKFKVGVTVDGDNSIDAWTQDLAVVAHPTEDGDGVEACTILVGGGLGLTHKMAHTFARLGTPVASCDPGDVAETVRAVVKVYRDHGNRSDRKQARLKYLVERWGAERFVEEMRTITGVELPPPRPLAEPTQFDRLGAIDQGNGRFSYGIHVENGRIRDGATGAQHRTAIREIVHTLDRPVVLTPMQSLLFTDLHPSEVDRIEGILHAHEIPLAERLSGVRRYAMACPALPTCGLALAESERVSPEIIGAIEAEFAVLEIDDVPAVVRITGCPNGCVRPYNADIGIVGRKPGHYHLYVGGGISGNRLADLFAAEVPIQDIVSTLRPLLLRYRDERAQGESLSDFYRRKISAREPGTTLTGRETPVNLTLAAGDRDGA